MHVSIHVYVFMHEYMLCMYLNYRYMFLKLKYFKDYYVVEYVNTQSTFSSRRLWH